MISSKTHEIISIPGFVDIRDFILVQQNQKKLADVAIFDEIKFVQKIGDTWQPKLNYSWFICCGYIPFSFFIKKEYMPTIDHGNVRDFVFDSGHYQCPESTVGYVFDRKIDEVCPLCGQPHENPGNIVILPDLWDDYPLFMPFSKIAEDGGMDKCLDEIVKLNYKYRRIYEPNKSRKGFFRGLADKILRRNSKRTDERKHIHGNIPIDKNR